MKEVRIFCGAGCHQVEYDIYNFHLSGCWGVAVYVFRGTEMQSHTLFPTENNHDESIEDQFILHYQSDQSLVIEHPQPTEIRIKDITVKL
jgi:hypothetical protein